MKRFHPSVYPGFLALLLVLVSAASPSAQEFRATLLGKVTDQKDAAVPGVSIEITNIETGEVRRTDTDGSGSYNVPFLNPGPYRISAYLPGFKRAVREGIHLNINDRVTIDLKLEIGGIAETITVVEDTPVIDSDSGSAGTILDNKKVSEYPLNGRNIFMLLDISTGVQFTQETFGPTGFSGTRPFDNTGNFSVNGSQTGTSEFLLDGAPNSVRGRYNVAPTVDAIQEFKVQSSSYDAQYGRTGGGVINMMLKAGTKRFHGSLFEFMRNSVLDANNFQNNREGAPKTGHTFNNFGFVLDGPVRFPWKGGGDARTFYMFSYEGIRERIPFPVYATVPSLLQRAGDFSQTFNGTRQVVIYDTLSTRYDDARRAWVRDAFAGNRIPANRFNPVALNLLKFIPLPNTNGDPDSGFNNYFATPNKGSYTYNSYIVRLDRQLSNRDKFFASYVFNHRDELRNSSGLPGVVLRGNWQQERTNNAVVADWVSAVSPRTVLNVRGSMNRFIETDDKRSGDNFDASRLGFKGTFATRDKPTYPHLTLEQYSELGPGAKYISPDNTASAQVTLSKSRGRHFMKLGSEFRLIQSNRINDGDASGRFDFTRAFTRRDPNTSDAYSGSSISSFLLGYPSGGLVDANAARTERWKYYVGFFQDDIKAARNLTLNLGLRWDYEQPVTEKWNRINRGFDFNAKSPLQDLIAPSFGLNLRGGLLFAGVNGQPRGGYNPTWNTWQPRAGLAWRFHKKVVLRGGYGLYFQPTSQLGTQAGFSRSTPFIGTLDNRIPAIEYNTLENPYPRGLIPPPGSSEGLATLLGYSFSIDDPNRRVPRTHQFSIGMQRELPARIMFDISYVGSRGQKLGVSKSINEVSAEQYAQGPNVLNRQVPNPFYGVLPVAAPLGRTTTVAQSQLMRPYPQFQGITMAAYSIGHSWYNSLQAKLNKQFTHGMSFTAAYTWSRNMEQIAFLNSQNSDLSRELASIDRTHRVALTGIWDLPFGRGKLLARNARGIANHLVGGWQLNWIANFQSGVPTSYPSGAELTGINPKLSKRLQTFDMWFNTGKASNAAAAFAASVPFFNRPSNTLRQIPLRFPNVRNHYEPQINISMFKNFRFTERWSGQLRVESFNMTNTPIFPGPNTDINSGNFGKITRNQINFPRHIQMALKLKF